MFDLLEQLGKLVNVAGAGLPRPAGNLLGVGFRRRLLREHTAGNGAILQILGGLLRRRLPACRGIPEVHLIEVGAEAVRIRPQAGAYVRRRRRQEREAVGLVELVRGVGALRRVVEVFGDEVIGGKGRRKDIRCHLPIEWGCNSFQRLGGLHSRR